MLKAVLDFVTAWENKAITKTGEIAELLDYLEYFREARGVIPLSSNDDDAVPLMTAHAAKGLEFSHVLILRANSGSFPLNYQEALIELPRELYDPDSIAQGDDKELCQQEERRLFYVAMTRARDSLTIYAKKGTGKKDPSPAGFLRDLLKDISLRRWLVQASARGFQTDMFAQEAAPATTTRTNQWLALPPVANLHSRLSASAVQTYETCPLQFKLEREWRIPDEVPAAMQYGAVMHRVLRAYYDSVRLERPMADDVLIQFFRDDLAQAGMQDRYQHDLYEAQGVQQLKDFLAAFRRAPVPHVLHTEEFFDVKVGEVTVVGRIDRIDQLARRPGRDHRLQDRQGPNRRKIPTRACSFPSTPWRRARSGDIKPIASRSITWKEIARSSPGEAMVSWKQRGAGSRKFQKTSLPGNSSLSPASIANFAPIAICVPPPRKQSRNTHRKRKPPPQDKDSSAVKTSPVILSGVAALRSEAAAQSKDPYNRCEAGSVGVCWSASTA